MRTKTLTGIGFQVVGMNLFCSKFAEMKTAFIFALPTRKKTFFVTRKDRKNIETQSVPIVGTHRNKKSIFRVLKSRTSSHLQPLQIISLRQRLSK